jgi:hypothetical protein
LPVVFVDDDFPVLAGVAFVFLGGVTVEPTFLFVADRLADGAALLLMVVEAAFLAVAAFFGAAFPGEDEADFGFADVDFGLATGFSEKTPASVST